jgi:hypothetical protein
MHVPLEPGHVRQVYASELGHKRPRSEPRAALINKIDCDLYNTLAGSQLARVSLHQAVSESLSICCNNAGLGALQGECFSADIPNGTLVTQ